MSDHKHLVQCVPCWLSYLIILVYMVAMCFKILTEALVVNLSASRQVTLSETGSQPLPSVPFLVRYSLIVLALDAMYSELLAVSLNKPCINKITSHLRFLCLWAVMLRHIPEEHNSRPHHCKNLRPHNINVL
jgi:DMSO/TMAO reductase YedYZ heme-binding membrane subunit